MARSANSDSSGRSATSRKRYSIFILSPHRGNAAFSLALSSAAWLRDGHAVTFINVFTRSLYAPFSDADSVHENDRLSYVSAMRRKEDETFLRCLPGARMIDLNIKDAPLRLHRSSDTVRDAAVDPGDGAFAKIRKALARCTGEPSVALVLPLALGNHVDHRVARDAALPLSPNVPCAFYEDLPDAAHAGVSDHLQCFQNYVGAMYPMPLHPVVCSHEKSIEWKREVALEYSSQIKEDTADLIGNFAGRYGGNERLWANDAFLALALATRLEPSKEPADRRSA